MDRKGETMRTRTAIASMLLTLALPATAQDFSKVEIKTTKLSDSVYMIQGAGGNLGLSVGDDATVLIDDQFAPLTEKIQAAIAKVTAKPVRFLLNTHWHGDHTGGNENFGKAGVVIFAHENVRKRMSTEQFMEFINMKEPPSPKAALPMVTFAGAITFHLNGDEIRVMHVPRAHTDGDAIVQFVSSNVIHTGDVMFNGMYPFIDVDSGGSVDGVISACDRILAMAGDDTKIIPGHGPLATKADLKTYRDMLETVAGRVRALVAQGKSVDDIKAAKVSAEFDAKWGNGFIKSDRFAEMLARDLKRNR
jgi:cyclase